MTATPDSWTEVALVGIKRERDSSEVQFAALTENITGFEWGDKEIEGVPNLAGGRFIKIVPNADESITLKMFPVDATLTGGGAIQLGYLGGFRSFCLLGLGDWCQIPGTYSNN